MSYATCKTINEKTAFVKTQLATNNAWLFRGIVAIYNKQTQDEKAIKETTNHNCVGFTGADAKFMSAMAERIINNSYMTEKQIACIRKGMKKYAAQLVKIADKKI